MRRDYVLLSPSQLASGEVGQQDIDYRLDRPPFTRYFWAGELGFVPLSGGNSLGEVANEDSMLALSEAAVGDSCVRTDLETVAFLVALPASDVANWLIVGGGSNGSNLGSVANEAAMLALTANVGDSCIRADLETVCFLTASPASDVANWLVVGGEGDGSSLGSAANEAAMLALSAAVGNSCVRTDLETVAFCVALPSSSAANWILFEPPAPATDPGWRGVFTTVAGLPAVDLIVGDTATMVLSGMAPFMVIADSTTTWIAAQPIFKRVAHRIAGTTSASAQMAAGWKWGMPAGLLTLFSEVKAAVFYQKSAAATDTLTGYITLGGAGSTSDTTITPNPSPMISAANGSRSMEYDITLLSNTTLRVVGTDVGSGTSTNTTGTDASALATLGGADDFTDALYWGVSVTMSGTTITPTVSLSLQLWP